MLVRAAWIPKECDRCIDDWTHRPDSMSTEALSGRNYLCESHYEDAKVILQQRQHRAEAVAPVSQIVSVPVSVTPVVKQPESASSEALEEHTANKNRYELSPNEHDDLASYVKNRSSQSVPTPDCVPNLADAEQPERNRSQNGLTATDNQKSCQDGIETKDVTESLSTKMAKVMLMPVKEPKQPTAALAALSVAPARTPNCASEEFCSGSGFVNRPHLYCSPDCKLNFYRNHLASWMESHEWVANRLTQAWVYLYFIKGNDHRLHRSGFNWKSIARP